MLAPNYICQCILELLLNVVHTARSTIMSLSSPQLIVAQKDVFDASAAVQTYVAAILRQPDIKLDQLPDLPNYQKTARQHAQNWQDQVLPAIITTNADIVDYANSFDSFFGTLVNLAEKGQKSGKGICSRTGSTEKQSKSQRSAGQIHRDSTSSFQSESLRRP